MPVFESVKFVDGNGKCKFPDLIFDLIQLFFLRSKFNSSIVFESYEQSQGLLFCFQFLEIVDHAKGKGKNVAGSCVVLVNIGKYVRIYNNLPVRDNQINFSPLRVIKAPACDTFFKMQKNCFWVMQRRQWHIEFYIGFDGLHISISIIGGLIDENLAGEVGLLIFLVLLFFSLLFRSVLIFIFFE